MAEQITSPRVYAVATDITSPMGMGPVAHWDSIVNGQPGINKFADNDGSNYYASKLNDAQRGTIETAFAPVGGTMFEHMCTYSARHALSTLDGAIDLSEAVLVLSTTKGNIEQLNRQADERTLLYTSAKNIAEALDISTRPVVVSHACISGSVALLYAQRLLTGGRYKHAIVVGCDSFTPFVLNGFLSFQAIADGPCRPFDADRTGINLGEAAATIILSTQPVYHPIAVLSGGATSNDANHISGPSRTGEELADAIDRALQDAGIEPSDINMISAHGTATAYNDEMEAKALHISGLSDVPLHSMKSYTGHTLGAAGVLESAMLLEAMSRQQLIPSAGYAQHGVSVPVNVTTQMQPAYIQHVLKTASGFGGSNAAIVWSRA